MAENNRTIIGIFVALLVIVLAVFGWWWFGRGGDEVVETAVVWTPVPDPSPTPSLEERLSSRLAGTTLSTSDAVVRELAAALSANPKLVAWLANDDLIRRFTASVDNIAAGISPKAHFAFLRPKEGFEVDKKGAGILIIEESSYERYDLPALVFASLDTDGTVALYNELKPLIDEAYLEIGPANKAFDDRLQAAFDQLLAVPVLEGTAEVNQLVLTYSWSDEELEALSGAQRHLLRMGPENVSRIQHKLGQLRAGLAAPPE